MYVPQIKISHEDNKEYKSFLFSKGLFNAAKIFSYHIMQLLIDYIKLPIEQKSKSYICIYYNAADFPILTLHY